GRPPPPPPLERGIRVISAYGHAEWRNDFEPAVEARHPELRVFRDRLATAGATVARLSGSGSTVFGIFDGTPPSAQRLELDARVIVTRASTNVVQVEVLE
ncbi:MAG: hypothetical protein WD801_16100, partial [Gemmatimonadaceae bacterium]